MLGSFDSRYSCALSRSIWNRKGGRGKRGFPRGGEQTQSLRTEGFAKNDTSMQSIEVVHLV